jgi:hypothetical protein
MSAAEVRVHAAQGVVDRAPDRPQRMVPLDELLGTEAVAEAVPEAAVRLAGSAHGGGSGTGWRPTSDRVAGAVDIEGAIKGAMKVP